jgi:hypothetical protein
MGGTAGDGRRNGMVLLLLGIKQPSETPLKWEKTAKNRRKTPKKR